MSATGTDGTGVGDIGRYWRGLSVFRPPLPRPLPHRPPPRPPGLFSTGGGLANSRCIRLSGPAHTVKQMMNYSTHSMKVIFASGQQHLIREPLLTPVVPVYLYNWSDDVAAQQSCAWHCNMLAENILLGKALTNEAAWSAA